MFRRWLVAILLTSVSCNIVGRNLDSVTLQSKDAGSGDADAARADGSCGSDEALCTSVQSNCGVVRVLTDCGEVTADCGVCTGSDVCVENVCSCLPKPDAELCQAAGKDCGTLTVDDCGERTIDCGSCPEGNCGEEAPNVCGCPCRIEGTCWAEGAHSPDNPCLKCDSAIDPNDWSSREGEDCDSGDPCVVGAACGADGVCRGAPRDCTDVAADCQVGVCRDDGSCGVENAPNKSACTSDDLPCTVDQCDEGTCAHDLAPSWCMIGGECFLEGARDPANQCAECRPLADTAAFVDRDGKMCDDNDGLDCTQGVCKLTTCEPKFLATSNSACYIDGACFAHREPNPQNVCQICSAQSPLDWVAALPNTNCVQGSGQPGICKEGLCQP